jgi:NAD(P)-dependent dehydrogenase (short-subunit alcohol dehydrogenase family)
MQATLTEPAEDAMAGVVIIGAGPGIGASVGRRFGRGGLPVGLVARSRSSLDRARAALAAAGTPAIGVTADAAQRAPLTAALDELSGRMGVPEVLVYNAGLIRSDRPGELTDEQHFAAYAVNVLGAMTSATHLAPAMTAAGGGTILITGGMPEPDPAVTSLSLGKAGVRALTVLLARQYGPSNIHVATVTIGGAVAPGSPFDPDRIAEHYWRLHSQPRDAWEHEFVFSGEPSGG